MFGLGWDTLALIAAAILVPVTLGVWRGKRQVSRAAAEAAELFQEIIRVLEAAPTDTSAHTEAIRLYNQMHPSAMPLYSGMLYQVALAPPAAPGQHERQGFRFGSWSIASRDAAAGWKGHRLR
jgi:hypothetical protein